ncbi:hypothetical protein AADG42_06585 [Ammonicoccus fulvus]|uniref:Uncharacterized protein n=1 Tax=Ammonicoccus fulvus TaxID=3138240 RepID=A0ABZ3FP75_9ACTN
MSNRRVNVSGTQDHREAEPLTEDRLSEAAASIVSRIISRAPTAMGDELLPMAQALDLVVKYVDGKPKVFVY